jgi:hypothetical protein
VIHRRSSALFALGAGLLVGALAGCTKADPKVKTIGGAATAASTSSTPTGTAPVTSRTPRRPTPPPSGTPSPSPTPVPQSGPGGLSVTPARPLPAPTTTLTVGAGPVVGTTARGDVFEHFRDWEARDLRALDPLDVRLAADGLTASRELVAVYSRRQSGRLFLRVDLLDLAYGAELGGLDLVVLLGWGSPGGSDAPPLGLRERTLHPYHAAVVVEDTRTKALLNAAGVTAGAVEVAFRSDLDAIELSVDQADLTALGWAGQPLTLQYLTVRDGSGRVADALLDRTLDAAVAEGAHAPRRAALTPIVVGNRAALTGSYLRGLVWSTQTTTSEGFPTGLHRTLESHTAHGLPLSIHLSGVLTNSIGWASAPGTRQDGPDFLARVAEFFDGDPANGEGDFLPGLYVDNMMPYFEGQANQRFLARAAESYREWLGVQAPGSVFWIPERVAEGDTLAEVAAAGFSHTVIDRLHLESWFGASAAADGKLHRVGGVDCFVIDPTVSLFAQDDGGPALKLRRLLVERALDPDPEQVVVVVADWEEYAGRKGNPNVPDIYDRVLTWLSQRPWIEVAALTDLAGRGWTPVQHGPATGLPIETHAWLRHACEVSYDHWYYGSPLEESLAALRPPIRYGRPHARQIGDVHTPGTLFGDVWGAIQAAPQGELRDLAEVAFASGLYRTAWHQEDMHDLRRLTNGDYVNPDVTYDKLSGFAYALATHVGEAATTAHAASWAANPPAAPEVTRVDVDLDGEDEVLLADDQLLLVFELDGGRLVAGFARAASGEGYQVLGDPMAFPSRSPEVGYEDDFQGAARNSVLKDMWLTGPARGYVNDGMSVTTGASPASVTFTSSDGALSKTIAWSAPGQVEVTYVLDPSAGTLYTRAGLNPHLAGLALSGQRDLTERDAGGVYTLEKQHAGATVAVHVGYADAGHSARRNAQASDGTAASPRNTAFQHMIELEGDAPGFAFSLRVEAR